MTLSIVIPMYNEAENIPVLYARISRVLQELHDVYELLFVDDGSSDETITLLRALHARDPHVSAIVFRRNFGHQAAITAGIGYARGAAVICMDADLQHSPEHIPEMLAAWRRGYAIVHMVKAENRGSGRLRRRMYDGAYALLRTLSRGVIVPNASDFYLLDRLVVDALRALPERARFTRGLIHWFGFPAIMIPFVADARHAGRSKYSFRKLLVLLIDGLTAFSRIPLRIASITGALISFSGFFYAIMVMALRITHGIPVGGWATLVVLILVLGGAQLLALGMIGEYVGRVFDEVKQRPHFVIGERIGDVRVTSTSVDCV